MKCNCEIHIRVDRERREKEGHEPLNCVGHENLDCPCRKESRVVLK